MKTGFASVLIAVGLVGCGQLDASAESKHICVQETNLAQVPAAPPVSVPATPPVVLRLDLSAAITDPSKHGVELQIHPQTISLGSSTGDVDFAGVETATMTVLPPTARPDLQPVVFHYQRSAAQGRVLVLEAKPDRDADLVPYLEQKALSVSVSFSGVPPQRAWTATLELCSETRVTVNYWDQITS